MGVRDPEVGKFRKNNLKLSRPRFNFGAKQKSELLNFVLEGHPNEQVDKIIDEQVDNNFLNVKLEKTILRKKLSFHLHFRRLTSACIKTRPFC